MNDNIKSFKYSCEFDGINIPNYSPVTVGHAITALVPYALDNDVKTMETIFEGIDSGKYKGKLVISVELEKQ